MWEQLFDDAKRHQELNRKESAVTVSTVETFVSDTQVEDLEAPVNGIDDVEKSDRPAGNTAAPEISRFRRWYWKYSEKFFKIAIVFFAIVGVALLIPGLHWRILILKWLGIGFLIACGVMIFFKGIAFFTSKEQREKALPYSGFNTFTPGVSWGKVFASQRENGGGGLSSGGGVVTTGHVF